MRGCPPAGSDAREKHYLARYRAYACRNFAQGMRRASASRSSVSAPCAIRTQKRPTCYVPWHRPAVPSYERPPLHCIGSK